MVRTALAILVLAAALTVTCRGDRCRSAAGRIRTRTVLVRPAVTVYRAEPSVMVRLPDFAVSVSRPLQRWPAGPVHLRRTLSVPRVIRARLVSIRIAAVARAGGGSGRTAVCDCMNVVWALSEDRVADAGELAEKALQSGLRADAESAPADHHANLVAILYHTTVRGAANP